jgi:hypothetical protein
MPGAPLLALTRDHALSMFSRARICSNRSDCARPCFRPASASVAPPVGFVTMRLEAGVAAHPSSSDLPTEAPAVLCPLLTPARSSLVQVSPDKNANANCTTPPFTFRVEPGTSLCGASSSRRVGLLYGSCPSAHRFPLSKLFNNVPIKTQEKMSPSGFGVLSPQAGAAGGKPERSGG